MRLHHSLNRIWVVADIVQGTIYSATPNYSDAQRILSFVRSDQAVASVEPELLRYDLPAHYQSSFDNARLAFAKSLVGLN